jgi:hypothetical protein
MANWNERRGHRGRSHDDPREDIHQGPWSPYNGRDHNEGDAWGARGRDYWIEDDRWEDRRMGMGDQWRRRDDEEYDDRYEPGAEWGNRMGLREEPIERGVPSTGPWQREPRYGEMERMWSDRDDHPWPNERRATDEERRRHQDYAHSRYAGRDHRDDYARERGGEQYPGHARRDESPRNWTDRPDRGEPWQLRHEQRLRAGRDQQRILDEERFGREEPEWMRRSYQRGPEDRGGYGRDDRDMWSRNARGDEMRGNEVRGGEMRGRDERSARYEREMRDREMRDRDMRGGDMRDREMRDREMRGRDMQRGDLHGHDPRGGETMGNREMRDREMHGAEMRDRGMRDREISDRDDRGHHDRDMHDRDMHDREMRGRNTRGDDDRDMRGRDSQRDGHHRDELAHGDRDDHGRDQRGDDRSGAHFGSQRRDRNRYD